MTRPYSSHHFIANCFIAGNIKGEWRYLFPAEPQFITTCSYPTIKTSATLMYSNRKCSLFFVSNTFDFPFTSLVIFGSKSPLPHLCDCGITYPSPCAQPYGPRGLMSLHVSGFVPNKVHDFVEGLPYHGDSSDDDLVGNLRMNFVDPWGNNEGPTLSLSLGLLRGVKVTPRAFAFGEKLGLYIVVPQQLIVEVGTNIVYMVTRGQSLKKFHDLVCSEPCKDIKLTYFITIFASVHFVLSHLPNFNSISVVSLAAAVIYSTIAWAAALDKGVQPNIDYSYKARSTVGRVFSFFNALGTIAFSYASHSVVLEIQATIPSMVVSYIVVAICYFLVAIIGFWMYGNSVSDNILISLEKPTWLIAAANLFVVVHVIGSYQIYAMPVFDMIETLLVKKLNFAPSFMLRFITRNVYVALTRFIGICIPFFGGLLGFFGGFAFTPTTYFLPCIIWLAIYKPTKWGLSWMTNWASV
nr:lysine histidine transporter 1-like [Tanacetum cinerariifolium]